MESFQTEANEIVGLKIVCIGIGGAGCSVIDHLFSKALVGIDLLAINTDIQSLEHISEVKTALTGTDIVFVLAGLGGGTGSGASPIIAKIAKEIGALTIAIVTTPFEFEGRQRFELAESGLKNIKKESDSVIVFQNEKLIHLIDKELGIKDAFKVVDATVVEAINEMIGVLLLNGENDINLEFYDLKTVMSHRGMALLSVGEGEGINSANEAIKQAIEAPLLEDVSLNEATGILIYFTVHPDFPIIEIAEAIEMIHEDAHYDADIIWGTRTDNSLNEDYVKVTMILTGFEENYNAANNADYEG